MTTEAALTGRAALVLTGGGARAAYQVGAIRALARITAAVRSPFPVLAGMSAGAINAAALAVGADDFRAAATRLLRIWGALTPGRVYRIDRLTLTRIGLRWIRDLTSSGLFGEQTINYLLDTAPLRALLERELELHRLRDRIASRALRGLSLSATNYSTATGISFFDGDAEILPWVRSHRAGVRTTITVDHLMASAAIPLFFPPVRIADAFFGDGCIRMLAPLSPALHMGADRIVAIGVLHRRSPAETATRQLATRRTTLPLAEIVGSLLNALFLDSLELDAERLHRMNQILGVMAPDVREAQPLRVMPLLVLRPSADLGDLAADVDIRLPGTLRYLLHGLGARSRGSDLLSYLAFEPVYVRRLLRLGYHDTMARAAEIKAFLSAPSGALDADAAATFRGPVRLR